MKRKVLIIMGRYLPGYKDGGPVRSIKNLVDYLGEEYEFRILTSDRDHGDLIPYPDIQVDNWNIVGKAKVYYVSNGKFKWSIISKLSSDVDIVYLCGCFNDYAIITLFLKRINIIKKPVVVAAMGLFSPEEFRIKYIKKKVFVVTFNMMGMFKKVHWSATTAREIDEIRQQVRARKSAFHIAEDLPRMVDDTPVHKVKKKDELQIVWISRIAPKKNLLGAISILQRLRCKVAFTIYGTIHDTKYWIQCQNQLQNLPANVEWDYEGEVESEYVVETLRKYHIFLFPTLGENYGHVIQEALSAGCPCILSDQTPWGDLEQGGAGYVFPLNDTESFANAIESYAQMDESEYNVYSNKAVVYAAQKSNDKVKNTGYRDIFEIRD